MDIGTLSQRYLQGTSDKEADGPALSFSGQPIPSDFENKRRESSPVFADIWVEIYNHNLKWSTGTKL